MTARPSPFAATPASGISPAPQLSFLDEALVIPHHELRFDLLNRIHSHAHHDQERGSAEVEGDIQSFLNESPHVVIKPRPQGTGQVMEVDTGDHPLWEQ